MVNNGSDPYMGDFPETMENYLLGGNMKCVSFNRGGTLLAGGCSDGSCVIWDFETRGVAREFRDKDLNAPITCVSWSKYGHRLLASAADKSLTLWDVVNGETIGRLNLHQTTLVARLHPRPSICLACPLSSAPLLVDFNTGRTTVLPVSVTEDGNPLGPNPQNHFCDSSPPVISTAATFDKHGDLIYVGNSMGDILIVDSKSIQVYAVIPTRGGSMVKNIVFSRDGQYLLTNSNDRVIRVYRTSLPVKGSGEEIRNITNNDDDCQSQYDKLQANGRVQNWAAFAPKFVELEENEEYVEQEDEFDLNGKEEKDEELLFDENTEVDVETCEKCEKNKMFSDLDDFDDEIVHLPAIPSPDAFDKQLVKCTGTSWKLENRNHYGSPSSMDAVKNN